MVGFLDTSARCSRAQYAAAVAAGYTEFVRCVGGSQPPTAEEIADCVAAGGRLRGVYFIYPQDGTNPRDHRPLDPACADKGKRDGEAMRAVALALNLGADRFLAFDLEGNASAEEWRAYADEALCAVEDLPCELWLYDGVVAASTLTTEQKDWLTKNHPRVKWWTAGAYGAHPPSAGYVASQVKDDVTIGEGAGRQDWDENEYVEAQPATSSTAPSWPRQPGESNGQYVARVARHYSGDSLSVNRAELAALLSRGGVDDPEKAVTLATNCATWACSVLYACGLRGPVAESFFYENGVSKGDSVGRIVFGYPHAWVYWDGKTVPPCGAVLGWAAGTSDWHVGVVDAATPEGTLTVHTTESGGTNNSVNSGTHEPPYYSWGRPLRGWLDPEKLALAAYVEPAPDPMLPGVVQAILDGEQRLPGLVPGVDSPLAGVGER